MDVLPGVFMSRAGAIYHMAQRSHTTTQIGHDSAAVSKKVEKVVEIDNSAGNLEFLKNLFGLETTWVGTWLMNELVGAKCLFVILSAFGWKDGNAIFGSMCTLTSQKGRRREGWNDRM
ncbi:predicted protein [Sclerotinia sclerotiorum 1980 UF-70]|uniref:Uncharacterized protein n=1 Tax=Sclerotinia sclerotiorum (strain ATCC 18683 / 1980 / Ss-1) TaxID=665079 RepID=A7FA50_SCLS1|nr:predicted protein [Sclerotinia sclerotiorum 1980 UF-70]EDO00611.1 predicted protein [Sclerotinia sclerotiorum 1980 UF-70]